MTEGQVTSQPQPGSCLPAPDSAPLLLYAGSCAKCRFLSRCVELASLGAIRRVSLERPEWQKFYYEDFPQAKGYPVLFVKGRPIFGARVFFAVPLVVVSSVWKMAWSRGRKSASGQR